MKPYVFAIGNIYFCNIIVKFERNCVIQNLSKRNLFPIELGGGSLFAIHNECEVYNPRTDRWAPVTPMNTRRSRAGTASLGKVLYVVGG